MICYHIINESVRDIMNIEKILKELTIDEKIAFLSGKDSWHTNNVDRLGIRSIQVNDGPHGLRIPLEEGSSIPATCFPPAIALGSSFNKDLIRKVGAKIAEECRKENVDILLGPGLNIKRSPLCGRNFEYYSEDPYLSGVMAGSFVDGVQSLGVGACVKHYAVNSQENYRLVIDSVVDERALREIYLKGFEMIIKNSNPYSLMTSYNRINGEYGSENSHTLSNILRKEWEYDGLVMSDWGAVYDITRSIKQGMDLEMPSSFGQGIKTLKASYNNNEISEEEIDKAVRHILKTLEKLENKPEFTCDMEEHNKVAKEVAAESFVLLKNNDKVLPISEEEKVLFIGDLAINPLKQGGGSSKIAMTCKENIIDHLKLKKNYAFVRGYDVKAKKKDKLYLEAIEEAKKYDKIVLFLGQSIGDVTESTDRKSMDLPENQINLLNELSKLDKKIVVILELGSAIYMPWIDKVHGLLNIHLIGQAGCGAVVDTIYGLNNPSGRLTETYALSKEESLWPRYWHKGDDASYFQESIFVGYRYYDTFNKNVLFPFGYGLSYSEFEYKNFEIKQEGKDVYIMLDVTNNSDIEGKDVIQIYVKKETSKIYRSKHELKGFAKVSIKPHETKKVEIKLGENSFTYYDIIDKDFIIEDGEYILEIASSSRDIIHEEKIILEGKKDNFPYQDITSYSLSNPVFSEEDFVKILGRELPPLNREKGKFHRNSTINDFRKTVLGRMIANIICFFAKGQEEAEDIFDADSFKEQMGFMPLRALSNMSNGTFPYKLMYALIDLLNYKLISAIKRLGGK